MCFRNNFRPLRRLLICAVFWLCCFGAVFYSILWKNAIYITDPTQWVLSNPQDEPFVRSTLRIPQSRAIRPLKDVLKNDWITVLKDLVDSIPRDRALSLVTSNMAYIDVLLNWLISATVRCHISVETIVVISLDENLHALLIKKKINSVYIPPDSLLDPDARFCVEFERVMMIRLTILRLLSHWGVDVVNYDTDAILLQDPHSLYSLHKGSDIVGSVGVIPDNLYQEWGITICIGVVLFRSSSRLESYWNVMDDVCKKSFDDQEKLNCALKALHMKWQNNDKYTNAAYGSTENGLGVTVLPYRHICRLESCTPSQRDTLYIWHRGGSRNTKNKQSEAQYGKTWFLKYGWQMLPKTDSLTGVQWLQSISYWSVTHS